MKEEYLVGIGIGMVFASTLGIIFIRKFAITPTRTLLTMIAIGGILAIATVFANRRKKEAYDDWPATETIVDIPETESKPEEDEEDSEELKIENV